MSPFLFADLSNPVLQAPSIMCRSRLEQDIKRKVYDIGMPINNLNLGIRIWYWNKQYDI